jgi:glycerol-3-phosphate dehydrogenase
MNSIIRDPFGFSKEIYDIIIVGGGIYGVMLTFEATKRGLKALLLEQNDFGGATTFNCLRILHGGLRYLQAMDLHRFRESVSERKWFLKTFPELVSPLPCLMPLYGNGLRRPLIMKFAGLVNDCLSRDRNMGVNPKNKIPACQILTTEKVVKLFPDVDRSGLKGGILWYDAIMPDPQFILMEIIKRSALYGAAALNYMEAKTLITDDNHTTGITALDKFYNDTFIFKSQVVVNATGPWCRQFASVIDKDYSQLFKSSLAWNVLFDKPALSSHALAIAPKRPNARTYFLIPWKNKLLAGTGHVPWSGQTENPFPTGQMLSLFLDDLNFAIPDAELTQKKILHIFSGLLPVTQAGGVELTKREVILDHSENGGPQGCYSLSGIKFTTARSVAEKLLHKIFPNRNERCDPAFEVFEKSENGWCIGRDFKDSREDPLNDGVLEALKDITEKEAVVAMDDLLFRRTNLWEVAHRDIDLKKRLLRHLKLQEEIRPHEK